MESTTDAVVCEAKGRVVAVNQRFLDLVGWTEPYTGQPFDDLVSAWTARVTHPQSLEGYFSRCRSPHPPRDPEELQPNLGQVIEARFQLWTQGDAPVRLWLFQEWRNSALAWVSHEIKNPLNAVLGFSELLHDSLRQTDLAPTVSDSLRGLRIGAKHLHSVLGDLLDLSRLESGTIEPKPEWVGLREFLEDVTGLYRSRFVRRGLEFQLRGPERAEVQAYLDPGRLTQILGNLLSNALRFTKRGWVALSVTERDGAWVFEVEDTGVGIPEDQQKTIFEPFIQMQGQEPRRYGGTGLGLAICRTLAQSLGARLAVASRPGQGSRFSVAFDDLPTRVPPKVVALPNLPRATLLVADDEASNHLLVKGFLKETPLTILSAHDGQEALDLWKVHRPQLVLLDLRMPLLSGAEVARTVAALDVDHRTTILVMSATAPEIDEGDPPPPWSGFLEKPFQKGAFLKFLSKYLTFVDEFAGSP